MKRKAEFDIDESYLKTGEPTKPKESPVKPTEEKKETGLFANILGKSPIKSGEKAEEPKGLFSGLFSNNNLFQQQETKPLFDFSKGSLFGSVKADSFSLFQNNNQNSFLNAQTGPSFLDKKDEEEEDEDNDPELEEGQKTPEIDKTKSKGNYEYEEANDKQISKGVIKFKVGDKTFEFGDVSIENKKGDENLNMLIFRNSVKLIMYQAFLLKKVTNFSNLNKKSDCLQVTTFQKKKEVKGDKFLDKYDQNVCKIMFNNETDCNDFIEKLKEITN